MKQTVYINQDLNIVQKVEQKHITVDLTFDSQTASPSSKNKITNAATFYMELESLSFSNNTYNFSRQG